MLVNGLYAIGLAFGGGALLGFSSVRFALRFDLLPEALNVGGTLLAAQLFPDVAYLDPGDARMRDLGLLLSALSGIAAAIAASDAHFLARRGGRVSSGWRGPAGSAALSFLVPGLGHFVLGRKGKGVLLFAVLTGLYLVGLALSGFTVVDRDRFFFYWAGQILNGGATALAHLAFASARVRTLLPHLDAALLFVTASGLLNVLVMVDAYAQAEERAES